MHATACDYYCNEQRSQVYQQYSMRNLRLIVVIIAATATCCHSLKFLRKFWATTVIGSSLISSLPILPAEAAVSTNTYINQRYHTKIEYPADWEDKTALLSSDSGYVDSRTLVAFVDPKNADVSASLVFSPVPADFARLTSFGGKDNLRSYLMPKGTEDFPITYEVLDEKIKGEMYIAEYIISAKDVPTRHVISAFALRPAESVVGLTVQAKEDDYAQYKEKLAVVLPSFVIDLP